MKWSAGIVKRAAWLAVVFGIMIAGKGFALEDQAVTTVVTVGSSQIVGEDMSAGRDRAIEDALVAATYQVLIGFLPQEVLSTGFQGINDTVFSRTDQFINGYRVLTESVQGKTYRLLIEAGVSVPRMKEALKTAGIWVDQQQMPRLLICVAEKMVDASDYHYWWNGQPSPEPSVAMEALARDFAAKSFIILQPDPGKLTKAYPFDLQAADAIALGRTYEADVVVIGTAVAQPSSNTMGGTLRSYQGSVVISAYRVSDGVQIAYSRRSVLSAAQESADGAREALREAAGQAGGELSRMIEDAWRRQGAGNFQLEVRVEGTGGNMASFVKFRGALSAMSGVDQVQLKEMGTDDALLQVAYQGSARNLADALLLHSFDTFGINISEVGLNSIQVQLTAK